MSVWIIVQREWEKLQINTERMWPICHKTNKGEQTCCKQCVNLNKIVANDLIQWVHSKIGLHRYTHLVSRHIIKLNGKFNVFVTLQLSKFVNISIGMCQNEDWWGWKYMFECSNIIYISIYYYYLAGCTTFLHFPAPIWQLYYIIPPVVSVIPGFFH